jgi:phenylacetate-CoA ligase
MSATIFANHPEPSDSASAGLVPRVLEREVRRIYERSPFYAERFPLHAEPLQWACFQEIPVLSKREIVARGHQAFFADYAASMRAREARRSRR